MVHINIQYKDNYMFMYLKKCLASNQNSVWPVSHHCNRVQRIIWLSSNVLIIDDGNRIYINEISIMKRELVLIHCPFIQVGVNNISWLSEKHILHIKVREGIGHPGCHWSKSSTVNNVNCVQQLWPCLDRIMWCWVKSWSIIWRLNA